MIFRRDGSQRYRTQDFHSPERLIMENNHEFVVGLRTPCWAQYNTGVKSSHEQWDDLIREIWDIGKSRESRF